MTSCDYIVVGAGTAGCVLAARLSADGAARCWCLRRAPPASSPAGDHRSARFVACGCDAGVMVARWRGTTGIRYARRKLGGMSAEPIRDEDPNDPEVSLGDLPERERAEFLRQYREAVEAARDPAGYRRLRHLLHTWRLIVIATSKPGYYEELEAVRDGVARTTPAEEAIPGWQERLAAARAQQR